MIYMSASGEAVAGGRQNVVKHALLTPRNPARSMGYRADRHRTRAPINSVETPIECQPGLLRVVVVETAIGASCTAIWLSLMYGMAGW